MKMIEVWLDATEEQLKALEPIKAELKFNRGSVLGQVYLTSNQKNHPVGKMRFRFIPEENSIRINKMLIKEFAKIEKGTP